MSELYRDGRMTMEEIRPSIMSWLGHAKHGDTWRLRERMSENIVFTRGDRLPGRGVERKVA